MDIFRAEKYATMVFAFYFHFFVLNEGTELEVDGWMNDKMGEKEKMPLTKSSLFSLPLPPYLYTHTHT
jgi:hypothetical protein